MAKITFTAKSPAMKLYLPLLASVLALASCSTAYKTGQTPDDVYYSPARERDEYVRVEKNDDRQYRDDETYREDRYLRMKTGYRRYVILDDYDYYTGSNYIGYYDQYRFNNWGYYNRWYVTPPFYTSYYYNPYYYNPYYSHPYYSGAVVGNVQRPVYNKPRGTNLNTYYPNSDSYNSGNSRVRTYTPSSSNSNDNYRNSGTNAGSFLRNTFGSGNNNTSTQSSSNTSSSSSSSSSGSSSSGSSSAPVRKF